MFARWITTSMAKFTIAKPCYSQWHETRLEGPTFPPLPVPIFRCLRPRFSCFINPFQRTAFLSNFNIAFCPWNFTTIVIVQVSCARDFFQKNSEICNYNLIALNIAMDLLRNNQILVRPALGLSRDEFFMEYDIFDINRVGNS